MKSIGVRSACALAVALGAMLVANPAQASSPQDEPAAAVEVQIGDLSNGDSVTLGANQVDAARDAEAQDQTVSASAAEAVTEDLLDLSEENGTYADADHVDVFSLLDGDAVMAVPSDTVVDKVTVSITEQGTVSAEIKTSADESQTADFAGPQMAAKWERNGAGGSYIIKIYADPLCCAKRLLVDGRFTWDRFKLADDGNPNAIYFLYKRFGDAQPAALSGEPDARIKTLRIQSFPYDSVEPNLLGWDRYSPASDRSDDCSNYTATFNFKGIGVEMPFNPRCGVYNMWRNVDKASSYWLQYQGNGTGNREVGYVLAWHQKNGTAGSMHDLNKIEVSFPFPSGIPNTDCTQTDADRNCTA